jgi:hypothetical protein
MGKFDVEVSAIIAPGEARGEMGADGKDFRVGELILFCYEAIHVLETNLSGLRIGSNSPGKDFDITDD